MKRLLIPIMIVAIIFALYEQSKPQPNPYILIIAIVIFMVGMMFLSSKLPSKNLNKEDDHVL